MVGGPRRIDSERGAVLVEAAIAIPILILLIFGSLEVGMAWEARSATTSGVRTALLRTASLADRPEADLRTLQSVVGEIGTDNIDGIEWIVIFNADTADIDFRIDQCSAAAGAAAGNGVAGLCTAYDQADLQAVADGTLTAARFDDGTNENGGSYDCDPTRIDQRFCASSRLTSGAINVGVAIQYTHEWTTGILPSEGIVYTEYAVSSTLKGDQASPPVVTASRARILTGGATMVGQPPTSGEGTDRESDDNPATVWTESGPLTLPSNLTVNATVGGTHTGNSNENATIPAGTEVCSYYVQIDRATNGRDQGSISFPDTEILGVIYKSNSLTASDGIVGGENTTYSGRRGLEGGDYLTIDHDTGTVEWDINMLGNTYTDDIRILTACD